jgi:hypothetical protein
MKNPVKILIIAIVVMAAFLIGAIAALAQIPPQHQQFTRATTENTLECNATVILVGSFIGIFTDEYQQVDLIKTSTILETDYGDLTCIIKTLFTDNSEYKLYYCGDSLEAVDVRRSEGQTIKFHF